MKSPRFDIRAKKLRTIFSPSNIEEVWKSKVRVSMRDQLMSDGIENFDFHIARGVESRKLSELILSGDYVPQRAQRILVEKSKGLCRQLVIPSVKDAIVLQCLSDALYFEVKGKAPTKKAFFEPKDHKFSIQQSGYGTFSSWLNFQRALFEFSKTRKFIVVTDISNYYDSISYVHLRNAISSISGVDECVIDMLIYVLSDLLWQPDYTPRIEVGLPQMNLDAPRLLAHCFLYELDAYLASAIGQDFVRFMDDIDIGVDTVVQAKQVLRAVDLVLQTKQVRLNSGKTAILTQSEAITHFRVLENARLDSVQLNVDNRLKSGLPLDRHRKLITARISRGSRKKAFDTGSGEKILKRWLGLAAKSGAWVKPEILEDIVRRRPAVRESAYSYIRSSPLRRSYADVLARASTSGLLVDDAAMVEMANFLVETLVMTRHSDAAIKQIVASNDPRNYFGLYSKLWLLSKYGGTSDLLFTLQSTISLWSPHERLGRLAASFTPLFRGSPDEIPFKNLLAGSLNPGVRDTYKFHVKLSQDPKTFALMFDSLKAPNPSRGTGITHPKFLCLLSALLNTSAPPARVIALKSNHAKAFTDSYYKAISKRLGI
ncbi:RNA-directed DNA polymerase [Sphingomonas sp. Leaf343]|uniref:RNA-directed DNA polymerase n=1 Tax=Sphingomonas sp. Leaf343 TaxID=1736345 RepID=UPI0009ECB62D|nr:RNA-directed DNA polymerase [Sphingomonas sp. Leaf343]